MGIRIIYWCVASWRLDWLVMHIHASIHKILLKIRRTIEVTY